MVSRSSATDSCMLASSKYQENTLVKFAWELLTLEWDGMRLGVGKLRNGLNNWNTSTAPFSSFRFLKCLPQRLNSKVTSASISQKGTRNGNGGNNAQIKRDRGQDRTHHYNTPVPPNPIHRPLPRPPHCLKLELHPLAPCPGKGYCDISPDSRADYTGLPRLRQTHNLDWFQEIVLKHVRQPAAVSLPSRP